MTVRSLGLTALASLFLVVSSNLADAQEILFTNNAAYLDPTVKAATPRLMLNGYLQSVTQGARTYQYVGAVLSNSYSTYDDIFNPAAGAPGTTFGYAQNAPFGKLPNSFSWSADIPLPVSTISNDPSNPTFITVSFYLVDKTGTPYNNGVYSTYCFMTYIAGGKVQTSPAGGPYFTVVPPGTTGMQKNSERNQQLSATIKARTGLLPAPSAQESNLNGFWDVRPSAFPVEESGSEKLAGPTIASRLAIVG